MYVCMYGTYEQKVVPHEVDISALSEPGVELDTGAGRDHTLLVLLALRLAAAFRAFQHGERATTRLHAKDGYYFLSLHTSVYFCGPQGCHLWL